MESITIYEAGVRLESGKYSKFIESSKEKEVDNYIGIIGLTAPDNSEIVKYIKTYHIVSTTPYIIAS